MGCGTNFVKYWLFFFNTLVAIIGLGMLSVGVGFLVQWTLTREIQLTSLVGTDWAFIAIGSATFITAFLGCCSFIRGSYFSVVTYSIMLSLIILVQVAIAVRLFVNDDSNKQGYIETVNELFKKRSDGDIGADFMIEGIQEEVNCCGAEGPQDYGNFRLPSSCCAPKSQLDQTPGCTIDKAYPGCIPAMMRMSKNWSHTSTAATIIGIACFELIGTIFAIRHAVSIKNMERRSRY